MDLLDKYTDANISLPCDQNILISLDITGDSQRLHLEWVGEENNKYLRSFLEHHLLSGLASLSTAGVCSSLDGGEWTTKAQNFYIVLENSPLLENDPGDDLFRVLLEDSPTGSCMDIWIRPRKHLSHQVEYILYQSWIVAFQYLKCVLPCFSSGQVG